MRTIVSLIVLASAASAQIRFRAQEIQSNFGVGYAILAEDIDGDGKRDVVAINPTQAVWFDAANNWEKRVMADGLTKKDNVCFAANDIDGDGKLDLAIGADWQPSNTASGGSLQWIGRDATGAWKLTPIGDEPTLHRMRWGDVDGDGKRELVVMPLHGRGNKAPAWEGAGARVLVYRIPSDPRSTAAWKPEVADDSLHIVHNFIVTDIDGDTRDEIVTASREGIHVLKLERNGKWSKRQIGEGSPGEIKLGRVGRKRYLATVEPWHQNKIVIYEERPGLWARTVIEENNRGGHALGWGDFDGDGDDELAAGWRDKAAGIVPGVAVYKRRVDASWAKTIVDDGGMAAEDLVVADLNGDGYPEIAASGRATQNVKIYWNETPAAQPKAWLRHEIASGYFNWTVNAADFTGDGKPDVITSDRRRIFLYTAPDWKQRVIHEGPDPIHSAVMDVDGDGDPDFIGAQYSPGHIFWLERPADPLRDPWPYHMIDSIAINGVDGTHGLQLGDVDRDGKLDLIANSALPKGTYPNSLAWFRIPKNPRTAAHWERYIFAAGDAPGLSHYHGFGDVNGDKRGDIASAAKIADGGNWFAWWEQPADPRKAWTRHLIAGNQEGATNILPADVNRDGKMDFIATRGHGKGILWFEGPTWKPHDINPELTGLHDLAIGDIDGDGDIDAVSCAKDDFVLAWFENDGAGRFNTHTIHTDQAAYDIRLIDMDSDGDLDVLVSGQERKNVVWYENRLTTKAPAAPRRGIAR